VKALIAALTLAGCGLVVWACTAPYADLCEPPGCITSPLNPLPSLVRDEFYQVSWLIAAPALGLALAIAAATAVVIVREPVGRGIATGVLTTAGVMQLAFFVGLTMGSGPWRQPWNLGAFGGALVTLAGLAPVYKSMRQRARPSDGGVIN
jgi:hypothetical protein